MNDHKLNFATFFSGIGAPEQALKNLQIPHNVVFACDNNKNAQMTYFANHTCKHFFDDIAKINPDQFKDSIDLLVFGAPCQSFSIAGKNQGLQDIRGQLFVKAIDLINQMLPKYFIAENVDGLLKRNKQTFTVLLHLMQKNYNVSYSVLNSIHFGIPQHRKRVYIVGIRKDISQTFSFPKKAIEMKKLKHLLDEKTDKRFFATKEFLKKQKVKKALSEYDDGFINCITNAIARNGSSSEYINYVAAINYAIGQKRKPTPRECARLQGFPDSFIIPPLSVTPTYLLFANTMTVPVLESLYSELLKGERYDRKH